MKLLPRLWFEYIRTVIKKSRQFAQKAKGEQNFRDKISFRLFVSFEDMFTGSRTPIFLVEKLRLIWILDKKRIIFYEDNIFIEKNLMGFILGFSI